MAANVPTNAQPPAQVLQSSSEPLRAGGAEQRAAPAEQTPTPTLDASEKPLQPGAAAPGEAESRPDAKRERESSGVPEEESERKRRKDAPDAAPASTTTAADEPPRRVSNAPALDNAAALSREPAGVVRAAPLDVESSVGHASESAAANSTETRTTESGASATEMAEPAEHETGPSGSQPNSALSTGVTEPSHEVAGEPKQNPAREPTPEPTQEPAEEPDAKPTHDPAESREPAHEPAQEAADEPMHEPTHEPTTEPTTEATTEPIKEINEELNEEPTTNSAQELAHEPAQELPEKPKEPAPEPSIEAHSSQAAGTPSQESEAEPSNISIDGLAKEPRTEEVGTKPSPKEPAQKPAQEPAQQPSVEPKPASRAVSKEPSEDPSKEPSQAASEPARSAEPKPLDEPSEEPVRASSHVEVDSRSVVENVAGFERRSLGSIVYEPNKILTRGHELDMNGVLQVRVGCEYLRRELPPVQRRQLWGTQVYTDDSDLVAVLVHEGLLPENETANYDLNVEILLLPVLEKYAGSYRHGLNSRDWRTRHDGISFMVLGTPRRMPAGWSHSGVDQQMERIRHLAEARQWRPVELAYAERLPSL